ncbi:MAG: tRNA (adenosine(37)-N6)-threonylcarbamoyltransferase complex dimerization subunit type 1 TsaB [Candidatus Omnitrophica bacterium]|nr:tRNA (adenosine(37)-N6)-threonylcarbamoyltransferase complex dimerization subunit type 1 TsaB [Candidatus Omnitrophota bacterium]
MNILAMDTSTSTLSLALVKKDRMVSYRNLAVNRRMADVMMPRIVKYLDTNGLSLKKIDAYIVGLGPGSFTSLRVGVSTIKGLCFGLDVPVIGIPSLDALAMAVGETDKELCVITDARRGLLYSARYRWTGNGPERAGDYQLLPWKEVRQAVTKPALFAGDAVALHQEEIVKSFGKEAALTATKYQYPQARFLMPLGLRRLLGGETDEAAALEPLYLYAEDCQVRK